MVDVALIGALDAAVKGRPAALAAFLRSDAPLTVGDREQLALLIEGKLEPIKKPRGRPRRGTDKFIKSAVDEALRDEFRDRRAAGEARADVLTDMAAKYNKPLEYIINLIERGPANK